MADKLHDHLVAAGPSEKTVDILNWVGRATMDIIGAIGFGHDFQCGESPESKEIDRIWSGLVTTGLELPGFVAPLFIRVFPAVLKLPVKAMKSQEAVKNIVKDIALRIVQNREAAQEKPGKDLLSTLLKMKGADSEVDLDNMLDHVSWGAFM